MNRPHYPRKENPRPADAIILRSVPDLVDKRRRYPFTARSCLTAAVSLLYLHGQGTANPEGLWDTITAAAKPRCSSFINALNNALPSSNNKSPISSSASTKIPRTPPSRRPLEVGYLPRHRRQES